MEDDSPLLPPILAMPGTRLQAPSGCLWALAFAEVSRAPLFLDDRLNQPGFNN